MMTAEKTQWQYTGDCSIEHGGSFYNLDNVQHGYADCVRVCPLSDAGGPDNQFWIERGTINIPDSADDRNAALDCSGMRELYENEESETVRACMLVECILGYSGMEIDKTVNVQVGKRDEYYSGRNSEALKTIDVFLRSSDDLEKYVRAVHLPEC